MMDWLPILAFVCAGFAAGFGVAAHIYDARDQRRAIERRLANWAG